MRRLGLIMAIALMMFSCQDEELTPCEIGIIELEQLISARHYIDEGEFTHDLSVGERNAIWQRLYLDRWMAVQWVYFECGDNVPNMNDDY